VAKVTVTAHFSTPAKMHDVCPALILQGLVSPIRAIIFISSGSKLTRL